MIVFIIDIGNLIVTSSVFDSTRMSCRTQGIREQRFRIEQRPAHQPHKLEDGGSNPSPAFGLLAYNMTSFAKAHLVEIQGVFFVINDMFIQKEQMFV